MLYFKKILHFLPFLGLLFAVKLGNIVKTEKNRKNQIFSSKIIETEISKTESETLLETSVHIGQKKSTFL